VATRATSGSGCERVSRGAAPHVRRWPNNSRVVYPIQVTIQAFRLDLHLTEPAAGQRARTIAHEALKLVDPAGADGKAMFSNRPLNDALDPLRLHPAMAMRCSCGHRMAWIALDQQGAHMVSANRRIRPKWRQGGVFDLAALTPAPTTGGRRLQGWVEDAQANLGSVFPTGERPGIFSGFTERRTHICRKCKHRKKHGKPRPRAYTHTNTALLRLWLDAIANGEHEIRLK
jgi:hypothetical protein